MVHACFPRGRLMSYPESHLKDKVQYYLPPSSPGPLIDYNTSSVTYSYHWPCRAFFCFIYLNTINTSEMSILQVTLLDIDNLPLCSTIPASCFPQSKITTWILCLTCPCYLKAGSSSCHLHTEPQQLRSRLQPLFTVELAIALHSGPACYCTEPASGSVSFHHSSRSGYI